MSKKLLIAEFITVLTKFRQIIHKSQTVSMEDKFATILQMHALKLLQESPNITVGELSEKLRMSSASVAQFCDRLVSSGWIKRQNDSKDRRVTRLSLTKDGEKELKEMKIKHFQKMSKNLSLLDNTDLKEMIRIMTKLTSKVEEGKS